MYYQVDGMAMGNALGPILANIFMANLEETKIIGSPYCPTYYRRYVDDTFSLFKDRDTANKFFDYINTFHPSIKFDMEIEVDGKLELLDTVISRSTESTQPDISTKVKKTDKGLFYHYASFIPDNYKFNLVSTLVYRIYMIASNMLIFDKNVKSLKKKLLLNGFACHMMHTVINKILTKYHVQQETNEPVSTVAKRELSISLPYLGPLSNVIRRRVLKLVHRFYPTIKLRVVFRRGFRISSLFNYKDRFPIACKSMVVYYICCRKCGPSQAYIGKTINSVYERFYASGTGHLNPTNIGSSLLNNINESGDPDCSFHFEDIKILESGRYDQEIRFIESILLKYDKQNLNTCERSIQLEIVQQCSVFKVFIF